ncbi:MAG: pyridoxal phosphate-dependent aminotransferase [Prevotellaceae bacterium]|jgi:aspartate aminotransferase|nr:pyridoxal phosphate-dependent aminotransferase [Prevotellaceae bacterium]
MPFISEKAREMPASPIRKLVPYSDAAKARGIKVYHLNIGQPDIPSPQAALDAVRAFGNATIEYGHSAGNLSYRLKLSKYYGSLGVDVGSDDILITTGGSEALLTALHVCLDPGDEVMVPEPFYTNYNSFAIQTGVNIVPLTTNIESGFALPPVEEFEKAITPRTRALLLCNPNNPTGYRYSRAELEKVREMVARHDLFLISDEVYRDFCYGDEPYFSCMELKGIESNTVLIDSTSKRYSMCGIRVGALITKNREIIDAALRFSQARLCAPILGQAAAEAALDTPAEYFAEIHEEYKRRRDCLIDGLGGIEGAVCPKPEGAFYTMVKLPVDNAENFARWMLECFDYKKQTVMVAPGAGFYKSANAGIDQVRIAYVLKTADLINAVECIKQALKVYNGQ